MTTVTEAEVDADAPDWLAGVGWKGGARAVHRARHA